MASFSLKKAAKASCTRAILLPLRTRGLRLTPSGSGKPAPRRAAHPRLATVTRSRGGFDESTPTQGSATAPPCGEGASAYTFRLRQACAETGRPPMAKRLPPTKLRTHLNNRLPLLLPIRTIPRKEFCPIFGVNLRILPISGACRLPSATPPSRRFFEALAWQACHSCHEGASAYAFRLRQACAETGRPPRTCDRGKEPRGLR